MGPVQAWLEGDPGMRNVSVVGNVFEAMGSPAVSLQPVLSNNSAAREIVIANNTDREEWAGSRTGSG